MATATKKASKSPSRARAAKKAPPAKKGVAVKKASPARKNTAAKKLRKPTAKQAVPPKRKPRRDKMFTGPLVVRNGVLGVDISTGFIPLEHFALPGERVEFAFTLTPHRTTDAGVSLQGLLDFIQSHADDSIMGVVRCCVT